MNGSADNKSIPLIYGPRGVSFCVSWWERRQGLKKRQRTLQKPHEHIFPIIQARWIMYEFLCGTCVQLYKIFTWVKFVAQRLEFDTKEYTYNVSIQDALSQVHAQGEKWYKHVLLQCVPISPRYFFFFTFSFY